MELKGCARMIYRSLFVGYSNFPEQIKLNDSLPYYTALAYERNQVFLYVESHEKNITPDALVKGNMIPFPNGEQWERAIEVFHYSVPMDAEQWHRKADKKPYFQLNSLRPEKISSYFFYHYQYQEERPNDGDKYGILFLFGSQLIFYLEDPEEVDSTKITGALQTSNTPFDTWETLMQEHFVGDWYRLCILQRTDYISFS